jgi:tRNA (guanine-N1)-methyltransferase
LRGAQADLEHRARAAGLVDIHAHNIRDWATDKHKRTDDTLCGGGQGMLMIPGPIFDAIEELRRPETKVILMTPQGKAFKQSIARELSSETHLILLCGHYEGIDHRGVVGGNGEVPAPGHTCSHAVPWRRGSPAAGWVLRRLARARSRS